MVQSIHCLEFTPCLYENHNQIQTTEETHDGVPTHQRRVSPHTTASQ